MKGNLSFSDNFSERRSTSLLDELFTRDLFDWSRTEGNGLVPRVNDGVLSLMIPKKEEAKKKPIKTISIK